MKKLSLLALLIAPVFAQQHQHQHQPAQPAISADTPHILVPIQMIDLEKGNRDIGHIVITESAYGLVFTPQLREFAPGMHGFHFHETPSCENAEKDGKVVPGYSGGGHWNPHNTQHGFPWSDEGHLGDLPALTAHADGVIDYPVLAPRLKRLDEVRGLSLMIHENGDNHADKAGGARIACGVTPK